MGTFTTAHHITYVSGTYDSDGAFVRTIDDGDTDSTFETGDTWTDPDLGFQYIYQGTAVVDGQTWPVFSYAAFPTYQSIFMDAPPVSIPPTLSLNSGTTYNIVCFLAGTMISTVNGVANVEELAIGDMIHAESGPVRVKWIGQQTVSTRFAPAERLMPVRFAAGSLGPNVPHSDLTVTADHAMLIDGVLCNASALVNGTTIIRVPLADMGKTFTVYHIETEAHEIILANGAPTETFIDNVSRRVFDNFAEYEALYGDEAEMTELPYPRAMSARQVPDRIRRRLAIRKAA